MSEVSRDIYDVAISFTSRDATAAALAGELATRLRRRGLRVFYFQNIEEAAETLGERLEQILPAVYRDRARVVALVLSHQYGNTPWTKRELAAMLERPTDDDGRARVIPIHAEPIDASALLPADMIHPDTTDLGKIVTELCLRCGRRGEGVRTALAITGAAGSSALLVGLKQVAGMPDRGWLYWTAVGIAAAGFGWAVASCLFPAITMHLRRRALRGKLMFATEGRQLLRYRKAAAGLGVAWSFAYIAGTVGVGMQLVGARLAARDVSVLIETGHLGQAAQRIESNRTILAGLSMPLISRLENELDKRVDGPAMETFPQEYAALVRLSGQRSNALEDRYLRVSGALLVKPGEATTSLTNAADQLRADVPEFGRRLVGIALSRQLEYLMDGNNFYYGNDGEQAWLQYRRLKEPTRQSWLEKNRASTLPNNAGLSPKIRVYLLASGDQTVLSDVLLSLSAAISAESALEEIARSDLSPDVRPQIESALVDLWGTLHAMDGPIPIGWKLARALARLNTPKSDGLLIEAVTDTRPPQERAHALAVLPLILARVDVGSQAPLARTFLQSAGSPDDIVRFGFREGIRRFDFPANMVSVFRSEIETLLQQAGPADIETQAVLVGLYRRLPEAQDEIIDKLSLRYPERIMPSSFTKLRERYQRLGPPPGYFEDAVRHADLLRGFGEVGDRSAIPYLTGALPTLAHGNMRIAAIESLWALSGSLDDASVAELNSLTNMSSSRYRADVVHLFERQFTRLRAAPSVQRELAARILEQTINTGSSSDRGLAIEMLRRLDPDRTWPQARALATSTNEQERIIGLRTLGLLWEVLQDEP